MKIKKMILIAACLLPVSVSAEEVGIWWENPTHNTDGSQIIEDDKIMSATIYAYDLGNFDEFKENIQTQKYFEVIARL